MFGRATKTTRTGDALEDDDRVDCDCGTMVTRDFWRTSTVRLKDYTQVDDSLILCEGGCNKWRHIWSDGLLFART